MVVLDKDLRDALISADSIISLLYYRAGTTIRQLDPEYMNLLDEALRKLAPYTRQR